MILFKMMTQGLFSEIHGCVSTGKEVRDVIIASLSRHPGACGARDWVDCFEVALAMCMT
jgi:hypothetical protein